MCERIEEAIAKAGGLTSVAAALGESKQTVWNWSSRGSVPADKCFAFEKVTGLARWHLRPDDWQKIWPDLSKAPGAPAMEDAK